MNIFDDNKNNDIFQLTLNNASVRQNNNIALRLANKDREQGWSMPNDGLEKYEKLGITPTPFIDLNKSAADAQSNWAKFGGFLAQTLSEVTLGTAQATVDIFDYVASNVFHLTEEDYQSAMSNKLEQAQDYIRDTVAPIYYNTDAHIGSDAMKDFGWWCSNATSIVSSLTLLVPSMGITKGIGWLGKAIKADKAFTKVAKWAVGVDKATNAKDFGVIQQALFSPVKQAKLKAGAESLSEAWLMRTMENYQESRDTYKQVYEDAADKLYSMSDEEYNSWINANGNIVDEDVNINSRDEVAKNIAKQAADRTFAMDFSNIIFDIIQLHGLKNIGRAGQSVSNATKNKVLAEGIQNTMQSAGLEAAENATKQLGRWAKAKAMISAGGKGSFMTMLEESTEGIEEAVNYIAQQEGITYGKALLEGMKDDYKTTNLPVLKKLALPIDAISTWTNMQNPFRDYLRNGELYDSAFWGVVGGFVFTGGGNVINNVRDIRSSKKMKKALEERGQELSGVDVSWMNLFDTHEVKAARNAMEHTVASINQLKADMQAINENKNIFAERDEAGNYKEFDDISGAEKELAKQRVWDAFVADIALRSINSGTFDMLIDYFNAKEVKDSMVKLGLNTKENIESDTQATIQQLEKVKDIYMQQSAFVNAQIAEINANKNNEFDEFISLVYAQEIAKQNTEAILIKEDIDKQIGIVENQINRTENTINTDPNNPIDFTAYRQNVKLAYLIDRYARLKADEKQILNNNDIPQYEKDAALKEINKNKDKLIGYLKNELGTSVAAGMLLFEHQASRYIKLDGKYIEQALTAEAIEELDNKILNDSSFIDFNENNGNLSNDVIVEEAKKLREGLVSVIGGTNVNKKEENSSKIQGLASEHPALFNLYAKAADMQILKDISTQNIATTVDDIKDRVNLLANRINTAKKGAIKLASKTIQDLYLKYHNENNENTKENIIAAIFHAAELDKEKAREIAKKVLTPFEVETLMDALDIFKFNTPANEEVRDYFVAILRKIDNSIVQGKANVETATEKTENKAATSNDNQQSTNSTTQPQSSNTGSGNAQNQQDNREQRVVEYNVNRKKGITGIRYSKRTPTNNTSTVVNARVNPDGTIELMFNEANPSTQRKVIDTWFNQDEPISIDDKNITWQIDSNPIFEEVNGKLQLKEYGHISKVEGNIDDNTRPVEGTQPEEQNDNQAQDESGSVFNDASEETDNGEVADNEPDNSSATLSTGSESEPSVESQDSEESIEVQINNYIGNARSKFMVDNNLMVSLTNVNINLDFDSIKEGIVKAILADQANNPSFKLNLTTAALEELVDKDLEVIRNLREKIALSRNALGKAASQVAMAARTLESSSSTTIDTTSTKLFGKSIFDISAKDLFDAFTEISPFPEVNGIKIVALDQLLNICATVYNNATPEQIKIMNNLLVEYAKQQTNVKLINDSKAVETVIDSLTKKENDTNPVVNIIRVNLQKLDARSKTDSNIISAFNSLRRGDKLIAEVNGNERDRVLYKEVNGKKVYVGELNGADVLASTGEYEKANQGWVYRLSKKNGVIQGEVVDTINTIFTSNDPDCVALRTILTDILIKSDNGQREEDLINQHLNAFKANPYIAHIIAQSIASAKSDNNLFFVQNGAVNDNTIKNVLTHLVKIWNYTAIDNTKLMNANTSTQKTYYLLIKDSVNNWFDNVYQSYDVIASMPTDRSVTINVSDINDGSIIYNIGTDGKFIYTPVAQSMASSSQTSIGVVTSVNNVTSVVLANGKEKVNAGDKNSEVYRLGVKPGYIVVNFVGPSGRNYFTSCRTATASDFLKNTDNDVSRAVNKYIDGVLNSNYDLQTLEKLFRDLFPSIGKYQNKTCPLFRCNPIVPNSKLLNKVGDSTISTTNSTINGFTFSFLNNKGVPCNLRVINVNGVLEIRANGKVIKPEQYKEALNAAINYAVNNSVINIESKACELDRKSQDDFAYGCIKKNGGLSFVLGNTRIPFESYNDFVIKNDFVLTPLKLDDNGNQFSRVMEGSRQKANQVFYVQVPNTATNELVLENGEYLTNVSNKQDYKEIRSSLAKRDDEDAIKNEANSTTNTGYTLAKRILGNQFDELEKEAGAAGLSIADLFPSKIVYDSRLNKPRTDGKRFYGSVAYSRNYEGSSYSYFVNSDNKAHTATIPKGIEAIVGPTWLHQATSTIVPHRQEAVLKLIHERIHLYLREHPISMDLVDVYNQFDKFVQQDLKDGILTEDDYVVQALRDYRAINGDASRLLEEFLVESLTSKAFYNYLNSKQVDDVEDNNKKENFFTKIIKAIANFFGWGEVNENSLLMKELNVLRNAIESDKINFGESKRLTKFAQDELDVQTAETNNSNDNVLEKPNNIGTKEDTDAETNEDNNNSDDSIGDDTSLLNEDEGIVFNDEDFDFDSDFDDDSMQSQALENAPSIEIVALPKTRIELFDTLKSQLSAQESAKFDHFCDTGDIEISCKIG